MIRMLDILDFAKNSAINVIIQSAATAPITPTGGMIWYDSTDQIYKYYHQSSGTFYPFGPTGTFLQSVSFSQLLSSTGVNKTFVVGTTGLLTYETNGIINANQYFGDSTVKVAQGGLGISSLSSSGVLYAGSPTGAIQQDSLFVYDVSQRHLGIATQSPIAVLSLGTGYGPHMYLAPKDLATVPIDNTMEYEGSGIYFTDEIGGRHLIASADMSLADFFTGILPVSKGGTNNNGFNSYGVIQSSGSKLVSLVMPTGANALVIQTTGTSRILQGSVTGQILGWSSTGWAVYNTFLPITSGTISMRSDTLANHSGVLFSSFASGEYLRHNGSNWINATGEAAGAGGPHTHVSTDITDFSEVVDDRVGALITAGTGIIVNYNDAGGTLTIHTSGSPGGVTDHGALTGLGDDDHTNYIHISNARTITTQHVFQPGSQISPFILGNNATGIYVTGLNADLVDGLHASSFSLTGHTHTASEVTDFSEAVDDRVNTLIVAGTGIKIDYNDGTNTLLIQSTGYLTMSQIMALGVFGGPF